MAKDGHPFPVPLAVYDRTIRVLKDAVARARLGNIERRADIRQLDEQARLLEGRVGGATFQDFIEEQATST